MSVPRLYRHSGFVMVRASTGPGGLVLPDLDLHTSENAATTGKTWLEWLWNRDDVRQVVEHASPAVANKIGEALSGEALSRRQWRRLLTTTCSYVLRWQRRATPFGYFAGINTATIGPATEVILGDEHQIHRRPDPRHLDELLRELEANPAVVAQLSVMVNNAGITRGDQFAVPKRLHNTTTAPGQAVTALSAVEVAVRRTPAVDAVLDRAASPIPAEKLVTELENQFPTATAEQITGLLGGLIEAGVLLTDLRPASTVHAPHTWIHDQLNKTDRTTNLTARRAVTETRTRLRALTTPTPERSPSPREVGPGSGVDLALDAQVSLPEPVVHEAEMAASVLARVSAHPFGAPAWREFHQRFRERYGAGSLVPVRELVSDSGLGYPAGFLGAAREPAPRLLSERDAVLGDWIQQALIDGDTEIALSESMINRLTVGDPTHHIRPERVELSFTVHANTPRDVDRGRFELWVTGAPPASSSMCGRFTDLLSAAEQDRLAATYTTEIQDAVLRAQLSFPPRQVRNDTIARAPHLLPWLLPIGEHTPDHEPYLSLDDLGVTADAARFYLVHRPSEKLVNPYVLHALEQPMQTPALVRFLAELPIARSSVYGPFDFGAFRTARFLPRIRYGRSILAPARWLLSAADLPGPTAPTDGWDTAFAAWRTRWHVPARVAVIDGDQRLPLNVEDRTERSLLRALAHRGGKLELCETSPPAEDSWTGSPVEFVVPLTVHTTPTPHWTGAASEPVFPGDSGLLTARLEIHPQRGDAILSSYLPQLTRELPDGARWWFRRYHDTTRPDSAHELHLTIRSTGHGDHGALAALVSRWAQELRAAGLVSRLVFDTTWPTAGRYGAAPDVCEPLFAADSAAALTEIGFASRHNMPIEVVAAVSMLDLAAGVLDDPVRAWSWCRDELPRHEGHCPRDHQQQARELQRALAATPVDTARAAMSARWAERRVALDDYRFRVDRDPVRVVRALLHEHFVRAVAVDPGREQNTNRLVRALALQQLSRTPQGTP
ncbi:lantibiotic dehydratase [Sciscionella marina]|uniref:lantibiotic dehydratase n=1 Tax=Sciscionella marina TaxID=508770 RepID=UPI0003625EF0|nr:lantibiotic dehydratase [Sciscionella marina]